MAGPLRDDVLALAASRGITKLNDAQERASHVISAGKHALVVAPTGFGKTEAAMLPILSSLKNFKDAGDVAGIQCLYVTPLRALNRDLHARFEWWAEKLGLTLGVRHADVSSAVKQKQGIHPPQLLVTTPETLQSMLVHPTLAYALQNCRFVVIDEVHELLESKRGLALSIAIERLAARAPHLQRVGLSATVADLGLVRRFVHPNAELIASGLARDLSITVKGPLPAGSAPADVSKLLGVPKDTAARLSQIITAVQNHRRTLVFVNTRYAAEFLAASLYQLHEARPHFGVHHSSLSKESRVEVETKLKSDDTNEPLRAVISTSSLELGIDVGQIDLVLQYGSPHTVARLLQRVGRSGHHQQKTPKGEVLPTSALDALEAAVLARKALAGELESRTIRHNALDILAHQLTGLLLDRMLFPNLYSANANQTTHASAVASKPSAPSLDFLPPEKPARKPPSKPSIHRVLPNTVIPLSLEDVLPVLRRALPFEDVPLEDVQSVARQLAFESIIDSDGAGNALPNNRTRFYYYENVSTIVDEKKIAIHDSEKRRIVGYLDESFVSEYLHAGAIFVAKGKAWRVTAVTDDEIVVERAGDATAAIPDWRGEEIPVHPATAREVAAFIAQLIANEKGTLSPSAKRDLTAYPMDESATRWTNSFIARQANHFSPQPDGFVVEASAKNDNLVLVHSFSGLKVNQALARVISALLSAQTRGSIRTNETPYAILFEFARGADPELVTRALETLSSEHALDVLKGILPQSALFKHYFLGAARRFGLIKRDAEYNQFSLARIIEDQKDSPVFTETMREILEDKLDADLLTQKLDSRPPVTLHRSEKWSPLATHALEDGGLTELIAASETPAELVKAFSENLLDKPMDLLCTFCKYAFSRKIRNLPDHPQPIECPNCKSKLVTTGDYADVFGDKTKAKERREQQATRAALEALKPARKPKDTPRRRALAERKSRLPPVSVIQAESAAHKKRRVEALGVASQIANFGKRAVLAHATYGIGRDTATRVLSQPYKNDEDFYAALLDAQKTFIRTRKYWKI